MKKKDKSVAEHLSVLRRRAEERLLDRMRDNPDFYTSTEDMHRIIHELSVHQIELEMQQEELLQSREDLELALVRYTELYDFAPLGYLTILRDSTIVEANLTAAKMLGLKQTLLKGDRFARFVAVDALADFNALMERVFSHKQPGYCQVELQNGDTSFLHNELSAAPIESSASRTTVRIDAVVSNDAQECQAVITDISRQLQIERENVLLQENLVQAQKMESIGRLAGGVAHDFNNMLQVMLGNIDLLIATEEMKKSVRQTLSELRNTVLNSAGLTRQLLAFARKQLIRPKTIDFNATVADMLNILKRLIGENIQLIYNPGGDLWPVMMDSSQIDQIMANLAINAKEAIHGIGTLTIETRNAVLNAAFCKTHPDTLPGEYVLLIVHDDGCGMNSTTLNSVFEPFFTTKSMAESSGLGLATVYGIVRQNRGAINVHSKEGEGTTFEIYLPRTSGIGSVQPAVKEPEHVLTGNEIIMLVEDDKSVRDVTVMFLQSFGYKVLAAESPSEALSLSASHAGTINLLVTDVLMPGMSGVDLAEKMKKIRVGLKILLISGYAGATALHQVVDPEMQFLGKPFSRTQLASKVRELLDQPVTISDGTV
jgi:signal transduction histidine kinase/ActR/RegA family two-component response regulator